MLGSFEQKRDRVLEGKYINGKQCYIVVTIVSLGRLGLKSQPCHSLAVSLSKSLHFSVPYFPHS